MRTSVCRERTCHLVRERVRSRGSRGSSIAWPRHHRQSDVSCMAPRASGSGSARRCVPAAGSCAHLGRQLLVDGQRAGSTSQGQRAAERRREPAIRAPRSQAYRASNGQRVLDRHRRVNARPSDGASRQSGHRVARHIAQASPFSLFQENRGCQPCNRMHPLIGHIAQPFTHLDVCSHGVEHQAGLLELACQRHIESRANSGGIARPCPWSAHGTVGTAWAGSRTAWKVEQRRAIGVDRRHTHRARQRWSWRCRKGSRENAAQGFEQRMMTGDQRLGAFIGGEACPAPTTEAERGGEGVKRVGASTEDNEIALHR